MSHPSLSLTTHSVWILGEQLSHANSALVEAERRGQRVVLMIESKAQGSYRRYHQHKLVLLYSAMRHFAEELRANGWEVDYHRLEETPTFEAGLRRHVEKYRPQGLLLAEPNDFLMTDVARKLGRKFRLQIEFFCTTQFLISREEFSAWAGTRQWLVMDVHYREMRKRTGYLMEADQHPTGGFWNFESDSRDSFKDWERAGKPRPFTLVREEPDRITAEVIALVEQEFSSHPGRAKDFWLPVNRADALRWLERFISERLECFAPYEELMATDEVTFFHPVLAPVLDLGLISPQECCDAAVTAFEDGVAPLHSVESFIRRVIGWREFINGVYWHRGPEYQTLNALNAARPIPEWFYTGDGPLKCLQHSIRAALDQGWVNDSQRLLVLGNFFLIAGIRPRDVLRWFMEMTVDGYDWVSAADLIGSVLYADGGYIAAKPCAAPASPINEKSDYCRSCKYRPEIKTGSGACPYNYLYWDFVARHAQRFAENHGMRDAVQRWARLPEEEKQAIRSSARNFLIKYVPADGDHVTPKSRRAMVDSRA